MVKNANNGESAEQWGPGAPRVTRERIMGAQRRAARKKDSGTGVTSEHRKARTMGKGTKQLT